jgi:hypothetical protein
MEVLNNFFIGTDQNNHIVHDYITGETNGDGKLYILSPELTYYYCGPIKNGKMNGAGIIMFIMNKNNPTFKTYEGDIIENNFEGFGKLVYVNGDIFVGEFKNGLRHGKGKMYNSTGDLINDNIWKNDIICGKVDYVEYYHGTKIQKVIGCYYNSVKICDWTTIRENKTISNIDFYKEFSGDDIVTSEEKIGHLETNQMGYLICQKIICPSNISDERLMMYDFDYRSEKIMHSLKTKLNLDKNIEYDVKKLAQIAIPENKSDIKDHTLFLYLNDDGHILSINEYINGNEYKKIIFATILGTPRYIVNTLTDSGTIKTSIFSRNMNTQIPILYYEGDVSKTYEPNGEGSIYANGKLKMHGKFDNGHIISGTLCAYTGDKSYKSYKSYEGTFVNDQPNGEGIIYDKSENKLYEGQVVNNKRQGHGISYYESGIKEYEGGWKNNKKHGKGHQYDEDGTLKFYAMYENNEVGDILS